MNTKLIAKVISGFVVIFVLLVAFRIIKPFGDKEPDQEQAPEQGQDQTPEQAPEQEQGQTPEQEQGQGQDQTPEQEQEQEQACIDPCLNEQGVFDKTIAGCECLMPEADENCNRDFDFFSCQPKSGLDSGEILTAPDGYYNRLPSVDVGYHTCNANDFVFSGKGDDFDEVSECQAVCDSVDACTGFTLYNSGESRSCYIHKGDIVSEPKLGAQCFKRQKGVAVEHPGCKTSYSYKNIKKNNRCEPGSENKCVSYTDENGCNTAPHDINGDGNGDCQWLNDSKSCCINRDILC